MSVEKEKCCESNALNHEIKKLFRDDCEIQGNYYYSTKKLVDEIDGLKIIIMTNDHNPPHFHIKANNPKIDCKIEIESLKIISGDLQSKYYCKLQKWYKTPLNFTGVTETGKEKLFKIWKEIKKD